MSKLHELLAVEVSIKTVAIEAVNETKSTLKNKETLFNGRTRRLKMFGTTDENRTEHEAMEAKEELNVPVSDSIPSNLNYLAVQLAKLYDFLIQKESSNQLAKEDIVIDGRVIVPNVPATMLLSLESELKHVRDVISEIPTMAPGVEWSPAPEIGPHIFKSTPSHDLKTLKTVDHKLLPQPDPKHPSQFVAIDVNKNIGQYTDVKFTGLVTPAEKAKLFERLDELLKAVKQARQRANNVEVPKVYAGKELMGYLFGDWFDPKKANPSAKV